MLEVVAYEAKRLFRDRLVSSKDIHSFDNILSSVIRGDWGSDALDNMTGKTHTSQGSSPSTEWLYILYDCGFSVVGFSGKWVCVCI